MSRNKITITFYTLLVIIGLAITIEPAFADDKSSLEIHNDVIYGGDQEQKQYEYYGNQADLFLGKMEEQNKAFKKEEKRQFKELTDKKVVLPEQFDLVLKNKPFLLAPSAVLSEYPVGNGDQLEVVTRVE